MLVFEDSKAISRSERKVKAPGTVGISDKVVRRLTSCILSSGYATDSGSTDAAFVEISRSVLALVLETATEAGGGSVLWGAMFTV